MIDARIKRLREALEESQTPEEEAEAIRALESVEPIPLDPAQEERLIDLALRALHSSAETSATAAPSRPRPVRQQRRSHPRWRRWGIAGVLLTAAVAAVLLFVWRPDPPDGSEYLGPGKTRQERGLEPANSPAHAAWPALLAYALTVERLDEKLGNQPATPPARLAVTSKSRLLVRLRPLEATTASVELHGFLELEGRPPIHLWPTAPPPPAAPGEAALTLDLPAEALQAGHAARLVVAAVPQGRVAPTAEQAVDLLRAGFVPTGWRIFALPLELVSP